MMFDKQAREFYAALPAYDTDEEQIALVAAALRRAYCEGMGRAEERARAKAAVELGLQHKAKYREDSIVSNSRHNALCEVADAIAQARKAAGE